MNPPPSTSDTDIVNIYEVERTELSLYFHWIQFCPALFALALLLYRSNFHILLSILFFIIGYLALYVISSKVAEKRANAIRYSLESQSLTIESSFLGFYSQKTIPLNQITSITLIQSPLMKFCKIWAVAFSVPGLNTKVKLYGLKDAARVREAIMHSSFTSAQKYR